MLRINTSNPAGLHAEIVNRLQEGKDASGRRIETWELDDEGHARHTGEKRRFYDQGWLEFDVEDTFVRVRFKSGTGTERGTFAVLHGRFLELLINHFTGYFTTVVYRDLRKRS